MLDLLKEDTLFLVLSSIWVAYFVVLGCRNTLYRLGSIVTFQGMRQNTLGILMDMLFYALTIFITIKYFI